MIKIFVFQYNNENENYQDYSMNYNEKKRELIFLQ